MRQSFKRSAILPVLLLVFVLPSLAACYDHSEPRVEISASRSVVRVGDTVDITALADNVEHPGYGFHIRDNGATNTLRALKPGTAQFYVRVSGLLHPPCYPQTCGASQGGVDSRRILLAVVAR